ncbi:hypothetical protein GALL_87010 [mine drainage metagenome]|uniref:Uncharacterized protein n=1 Tax=mine drainage metagenome TaxID=410659 RepID=A0A1J5TAC5_9ZZZZ
MPTLTVGNFILDYTLRTNAAPGADLQFGMDFTVRQSKSPLPLMQLIYPATSVGTNVAGKWNVDNHQTPGSSAQCLVFANADGGVITDIPTELSKRGLGVRSTKFAVYRVDLGRNAVQVAGITFGYSIDTSAEAPVTTFTALQAISLPNDQKQVVLAKCAAAKFL